MGKTTGIATLDAAIEFMGQMCTQSAETICPSCGLQSWYPVGCGEMVCVECGVQFVEPPHEEFPEVRR